MTPRGVEEERVGRKGKPGQAQGSGKGDGIGDGNSGRDREKGEGRSERGGWVKKGNVVDRLSTVNVSYPRVDCNSA